MENKITIIGSGALGTALAKVLYDSGNENITIYGIDENEISDLSKGINTKHFPNSVELPKFNTTLDIKEALEGTKYIVIAVPSIVMNLVIPQIVANLDTEALIINGSKGFYPGTEILLQQGILGATKDAKLIRGVVSLIGPSFASEIILEKPTMVSAVNKKKAECEEVQKLFTNDYFNVYVQTDINGAQVGAAFKNILSIASGMIDELGYGANAIAALLSRGIVEMQAVNKVMKGKSETLMGLTGFGDLFASSNSKLSRNYAFGKNYVKDGKKALDTEVTIEGLAALETVNNIKNDKNLDLPITEFLYSVIHKDEKPINFKQILWNKSQKYE